MESDPQSITFHQLGYLRVTSDGKLFWRDKPVVTEERIILQKWVNIAICAGAAGGLLGGLATAVLAYLELKKAGIM